VRFSSPLHIVPRLCGCNYYLIYTLIPFTTFVLILYFISMNTVKHVFLNKVLYLTVCLLLWSFLARPQEHAFFLGTTYKDSGAMGEDEIQTWKYRNFLFMTITPGVARPLPYSKIEKEVNGTKTELKNNQLFGANYLKVLEIINAKLETEFNNQKKKEPLCFKEFYPAGINDFRIFVDADSMYFNFVWDESFLTNGVDISDCPIVYPSTTVAIALIDISGLIPYEIRTPNWNYIYSESHMERGVIETMIRLKYYLEIKDYDLFIGLFSRRQRERINILRKNNDQFKDWIEAWTVSDEEFERVLLNRTYVHTTFEEGQWKIDEN
jgi:hypothetical protein